MRNINNIILYHIFDNKDILLTLNTYPIKDSLKQFGFRWDPMEQGWILKNANETIIKNIFLEIEKLGYFLEPSIVKYAIPGYDYKSNLLPPPPSGSNKLVYSRSYAYGAPWIYLRGGALKNKLLLKYLMLYGFHNDINYSLGGVYDEHEIKKLFGNLKKSGYSIFAKANQNQNYIIDGYEDINENKMKFIIKNYLNELINEQLDKNQKRVLDIIKKANGSLEKEKLLSKRMADSIKDYDKAISRAEISFENKKIEMAEIFLDRAEKLKLGNLDPASWEVRQMMNKVNSLKYNIRNYKNWQETEKSFSNEYETSSLNKNGVFYRVGIPAKYKMKDNKDLKVFRWAVMRIVQHLAGQKHVFIDVLNFNGKSMEVRVSPNFTYPKYKLKKAFREYPKLFMDYLNKSLKGNFVTQKNGKVFIHKDFDFEKFIKSVAHTDLMHYGKLGAFEKTNESLKLQQIIKI